MKLVGNYWLGVLLYMIFFIVIAELGRFLLLHVFRVSKDKICVPRIRRIVGCVCATLIMCISFWGVVNARLVRVTPYDVTINKEARDENGQKMDSMKIVLVADLHLGYNIGVRQVQRIVNSINKQDADLVLIAGDIFDNEWEAVDQPEELEKILRGSNQSMECMHAMVTTTYRSRCLPDLHLADRRRRPAVRRWTSLWRKRESLFFATREC